MEYLKRESFGRELFSTNEIVLGSPDACILSSVYQFSGWMSLHATTRYQAWSQSMSLIGCCRLCLPIVAYCLLPTSKRLFLLFKDKSFVYMR